MAGTDRVGLTPEEGRRFGVTVGGAFVVLACFLWWREQGGLAAGTGTIGAVLTLAGLVVPAHLKPVQDAWMRLATAISRVTTPIVLGILYFLVIMPIGLFVRAGGRNPLQRKESGRGFWVERPEGARRGNLERQF